MNKNDKKLYKKLNNNIQIPQNYIKTIHDTFDKLPEGIIIKNTYNKFKLSIVMTCCSVLLITGCVFGKEISNYIKYFFNSSNGLDTAIKNGYIENNNLNYITNNTNVEITNFLMDNLNLSFSILVKLDDTVDIDQISKVNINKIFITDEEKNILFCDNKESFSNYINENNLNYQFNIFNEKYINSTYNFYIKHKDYNNNTIEIICNFYSNNFPKSKNLEINFENISLLNENGDNYIFNQSTNFKIEVKDKFYNREEIEYIVTKCSNPTLNITKAILYNTGFRFEFDAEFKPWYEKNASEEEIKKAYEAFSEWKKNEKISNGKNITFIEDAYIENEIGEKFLPLKSSTEDTFIQYQTSGKFNYMQTFDLTQFDINSQKIKIYFNINLPYIKEPVVVELECK